MEMLTEYGRSELRRLAEVLVALYVMGGPCVMGEAQWEVSDWHGTFLFALEDLGLCGGQAFWDFLWDVKITNAPALSCLLRVERVEAMLTLIGYLLDEDLCDHFAHVSTPEAVLDHAVGERENLRPYM